MVFHGHLVGLRDFSKWFHDFHGFPWFLVGFHGLQGGFIVFHFFWLVFMVFQGGFMVFGSFPLFLKVVSWFLLFLVGFYGFSR